jgi:hypothetical protein
MCTGCVPTSNSCGTSNCGSGTDNCGNAVSCGTCPTGQTCSIADGGTNGTCVTPPPPPGPCDPNNPAATSESCLSSISAACLACAQVNGCLAQVSGGATCNTLTANANLLATTLPDGKTCAQVTAPASTPVTERAVCLETMQSVLTSKCGASTQLTPCLCGTTDTNMCLAGSAVPTGPAFDLYACDFGTVNGSTINSISANFSVPSFGAGSANAILGCAGAFACHCLGD